MVESSFVRAVIINFISAAIITGVTCYFLLEFKLTDVMYIGNLFGLYFLVVFGTDILVDAKKIENNYKRFLFVILNILVFDILFLMLIPLVFGQHVLDSFDTFLMVFNDIEFNLILNAEFYMAVFAILMLIFNYLIYRKINNHV